MSYPIIPNGKLSQSEIEVIKEAVKSYPNKFENFEKMIKKIKEYENKGYNYEVYFRVD